MALGRSDERRIRRAWLWALPAFLACGGDAASAPSGGSSESGVSPQKPVADLSDAEVRALCAWSNKLRDDSLTAEQICTYNALLSDDARACERARDSCISDAKAGQERGLLRVSAVDCAALTAAAVPEGCEANVAAVEDCQRELLAAMEADARRASCTNLGMLWTPLPESCADGVAACTELFTGR